MFLRLLSAVCICAGLFVAAHGQGLRAEKKPPAAKVVKPEPQAFTEKGTIQAVTRGRIQMATDATEAAKSWTVMIDPKTVVHVTGSAEPDFLRAGLFVRFTAELDKSAVAKEKVQQLTIFSPSPANQPGVWPGGEAPSGDKPAEGGSRRGGGAARGAVASKALEAGVYTVAGRITGFRKGRLMVNAGRSTVRADVAEDAKIDVDFADYLAAKPGDKISVTKGMILPARPGLAQAQELSIQLSEPLALPKKKPARSKLPAAESSRRGPKKAGSR
jgi:hypothetical protein